MKTGGDGSKRNDRSVHRRLVARRVRTALIALSRRRRYDIGGLESRRQIPVGIDRVWISGHPERGKSRSWQSIRVRRLAKISDVGVAAQYRCELGVGRQMMQWPGQPPFQCIAEGGKNVP